ncbi:MAG TPA: tripartite tricarboxylate transporter substrate-binding protein [Rhodoblastus sp.]|nr:tripartite tricarboxylate transporter substrate-binding protein [Rhodoblastus sp.]
MDRRQFMAGVAASAGMFGGPALAADGLLKFIYPYAPGSGGDILVRVLADDLQKKLGISAIVDNKPGADGRIGVREVKHAAPDGNTLLFTPFGTMVLFPTVFKSLPYDAFKDFAPVTQALTFDFGLAAGPMSGAKTLAELTEWLKKNPDKGNVGMPGLGALPHLLPLKYAADAGVKLKAIAYKGTAPALTAAMSGETALVCAPLADLIAQHKAGAIHLLATSGRTRSPYLPDVPTFIDQGFKIEGSGWYGVFAPAGTPPETIARLNKALVDAIHSPQFQERAKSVYLRAVGTTPEELGAIQKADYERWKPVIEAAGLAGK